VSVCVSTRTQNGRPYDYARYTVIYRQMRMQNGMTFWVSLRNASFFMKNVDKTMYSGAAT